MTIRLAGHVIPQATRALDGLGGPPVPPQIMAQNVPSAALKE